MADKLKLVTLVEPTSGATQDVPEEQVKSYLQSGFIPDTPELQAQRAAAEKYSTPTEELKTGAEGLLRGGTGGLSDLAEGSLLGNREDIAARKAANPDLANTAEVGGLLGSLAVPGLGEENLAVHGAEAAGEGAGYALGKGLVPGAIDYAGQGAENITKRLLQGAPTKGIAGAVTDLVPGAVNTATQSALYNAGQQIDENYLAGGDLQQGAQNALASTPDAMAIGGILHMGGGLLAEGANTVAQAAVNKAANFFRETATPAIVNNATNLLKKYSGDALKAARDASLPQDEMSYIDKEKGILSQEEHDNLLNTHPHGELNNEDEAEVANAGITARNATLTPGLSQADINNRLSKNFSADKQDLYDNLNPMIQQGNKLALMLKSDMRPLLKQELELAPERLGITEEEHVNRMLNSADKIIQAQRAAFQEMDGKPLYYNQTKANLMKDLADKAEIDLQKLGNNSIDELWNNSKQAKNIKNSDLSLEDKQEALSQAKEEFINNGGANSDAMRSATTAMQINDFMNEQRDQLSKYAYDVPVTALDKATNGVFRDVRRQIKEEMINPEVRGKGAAALQSRIDAAIKERNDQLKWLKPKLLVRKPGAEGKNIFSDYQVAKQGKLSTYAGQLGDFRGEDTREAVNALIKNTQELIELNVKKESINASPELKTKALEKLYETKKYNDETKRLQNDFAQKWEGPNKLRGMGNGPYTTGIDPITGLTVPQKAPSMLGTGLTAGLAAAHPILSGVVAGATLASKVAGFVEHPLEAIKVLAHLEHFSEFTTRKIQKGITSFLDKSKDVADNIAGKLRPVVSKAVAEDIPEEKTTYKEQLQAINELKEDNLKELRTHQELQGEHSLLRVQSPLAEHAPKFTKLIGDQQNKLIQFKVDNFPQNPNPGKFSLYQPPKADMVIYDQKMEVAAKPLIVLDKLQAGTLSTQDVTVLKQLWPKIYEQMSDNVNVRMANLKHDLTYSQKNQLSILLGNPVSSFQNPDFKNFLQQGYAAQSNQKAQQTQATTEGETKIADSFKTGSDKLLG